jgi:maleamate amidohydrolase
VADIATTYREAGFTGAFERGARPAIVVVDLCRGFTDPASPLGAEMDEVLERTHRMVAAARAGRVPIFFTTIVHAPGSAWVRKVPSLAGLAPGSPWIEIDPRLHRQESEPVLAKTGASAFFGTPLHSLLVARGVDGVYVAGATTSGCVRATVVDAVQHGFATFVVTDCVADRARAPHEANLFDMTTKYADPVTADEVVAHVQGTSP